MWATTAAPDTADTKVTAAGTTGAFKTEANWTSNWTRFTNF